MKPTIAILAAILTISLFSGLASAQSNPNNLVIINSGAWQDAITASSFARAAGYQFNYLLGTEELSTASTIVYNTGAKNVILLDSTQSSLPGMAVSLNSLGLTVQESSFTTSDDLSAIVLKDLKPTNVILVRSDFSPDALSATYLSYVLNAPILFSNFDLGPSSQLVSDMQANGVQNVYALGGISTAGLDGFKVTNITGTDQFDDSYQINKYAFSIKAPPRQSFITTSDVLESSVLESSDFPVFVVPSSGLFSLPQIGELMNETNQEVIVGIDATTDVPGAWLKYDLRANNVRFIIKVALLNTAQPGSSFVRQDVYGSIPGYPLSNMNYSFQLESVSSTESDLFGLDTGRFMLTDILGALSKQAPAPPVELTANINNTGNVGVGVQVFFNVVDSNGQPVTAITSPVTVLSPGAITPVSVFWAAPPNPGNFTVQARALATVYGGITQSASQSVFVDWGQLWFSLLILLLFLVLVIAIGWYSMKMRNEKEDE